MTRPGGRPRWWRAVLGIGLVIVLGACDYAGSAGPKLGLFGDSVADDADWRIENQLTRSYRLYQLNLRSGTTSDQIGNVRALVRDDKPRILIIELGIGDAQAWHGDTRMRNDIQALLERAASVDCVRWLNLKVAGVNPFYQGVVARSDDFNRILGNRARRFANTQVVDYDAWAQAHPEHFLADGLHHDFAGRAAYAQWLRTEVAASC